MDIARTCRHLFASRILTRRRFSAEVLQSIEAATAAAEARTSAELRFVVETAFDMPELWAGATARERALQTFSDLHLWNTELRNGVLIYVLMAERDVEVIADRGAAAVIPVAQWEGVCRIMEKNFREKRFAEGALAGIDAVRQLLERHFPGPVKGKERDELPNQPVLL